MFDSNRLRHDIGLLSADCIHLKKQLRSTWVRPMAEEQQRLVRVRRKLTELFVILAASRGRLHVKQAPRDVDPTTWEAAAYHQAVYARAMDQAVSV